MYKGGQDGIDCNTLAHHFPFPYSLSPSLSHLVAMWCRLHRCIVASLLLLWLSSIGQLQHSPAQKGNKRHQPHSVGEVRPEHGGPEFL